MRAMFTITSILSLVSISDLTAQGVPYRPRGGRKEEQISARRFPTVAKRYCTPNAYQVVQKSTNPIPTFGDGICEVVYYRGEPRVKREFTTMDGKLLLLDYSIGSVTRQYTLHWELGDDCPPAFVERPDVSCNQVMGWTVVGVEWP